MGFFFSKVAGCDSTDKGLHLSFFQVNVLWNFSDQLYCETFPREYYCSFRASVRFYHCSERSNSIYLSKFGQLPLHRSATTIIIWLTKQIKIPYIQSLRAVLWNRSLEKKSEHITFSWKPLWWSLVWLSHMVMLFSKHFKRTFTLKIPWKNAARKCLFGNDACNFTVRFSLFCLYPSC